MRPDATGSQRGFTLVELVVVVAITSIIASAVATTVFQLLTVSARSSAHMTAVKQVENAVHWLRRDVSMAQTAQVEVNGGYPEGPEGTGFPLRLTWIEWDTNRTCEVTYYLEESSERWSLNRRVVQSEGGQTSDVTTTVAWHIVGEPASTRVELGSNTIAVTLTAAVGDGPQPATETRVITIVPRSML